MRKTTPCKSISRQTRNLSPYLYFVSRPKKIGAQNTLSSPAEQIAQTPIFQTDEWDRHGSETHCELSIASWTLERASRPTSCFVAPPPPPRSTPPPPPASTLLSPPSAPPCCPTSSASSPLPDASCVTWSPRSPWSLTPARVAAPALLPRPPCGCSPCLRRALPQREVTVLQCEIYCRFGG
jgi:hypothetical protein